MAKKAKRKAAAKRKASPAKGIDTSPFEADIADIKRRLQRLETHLGPEMAQAEDPEADTPTPA